MSSEENIVERPSDLEAANEENIAQGSEAHTKESSPREKVNSEEFLDWKIEKLAEEKIEKALEKAIPKIEERIKSQIPQTESKKDETEKERKEYTKKIWKYFPGAKTKDLSTAELKGIVEQLDTLAAKVQYKPILPGKAIRKFWGNPSSIRKTVMMIVVGAFLVALTYRLVWGW